MTFKSAEDKCCLIVQKNMDIMIGIDDGGFIVLWNEKAEQSFGRKKSEVLGKKAAEILEPFTKLSTSDFVVIPLEPFFNSAELRFQDVINQSTLPVTQVEFNGKFTLVNEWFCRLTGYSEEELIEMNMEDIIHPDDLSKHKAKIEESFKTGKNFLDRRKS